jgi:hypothetical protein
MRRMRPRRSGRGLLCLPAIEDLPSVVLVGIHDLVVLFLLGRELDDVAVGIAEPIM